MLEKIVFLNKFRISWKDGKSILYVSAEQSNPQWVLSQPHFKQETDAASVISLSGQ